MGAMKARPSVLAAVLAVLFAGCGDRAEDTSTSAQAPASVQAVPGAERDSPTAVAEAPATDAPTPHPAEPEPGTQAPVAAADPVAADPAVVAPARPAADSPAPAVKPPAPAPEPPAPSAPSSVTASMPGTVLRAEKLHREPAATSAVTGELARGARVEILARQSGWLRVKAGAQDGWIRLLSVRTGSGGGGAAGVDDIVGAATTRSDPTRVIAVAGLRGLDSEDLKQAEFNGEELARMEAGSVSAAQASSFANRSGLAAVRVPDLPKPQAR